METNERLKSVKLQNVERLKDVFLGAASFLYNEITPTIKIFYSSNYDKTMSEVALSTLRNNVKKFEYKLENSKRFLDEVFLVTPLLFTRAEVDLMKRVSDDLSKLLDCYELNAIKLHLKTIIDDQVVVMDEPNAVYAMKQVDSIKADLSKILISVSTIVCDYDNTWLEAMYVKYLDGKTVMGIEWYESEQQRLDKLFEDDRNGIS